MSSSEFLFLDIGVSNTELLKDNYYYIIWQ